MELYPKFIIEGDKLILAKVTFHHELVTDKANVKGGGWFRYNADSNTFILHGTSFDFGAARMEDIKACVEAGNVYSDKRCIRSLSRHRFAYNTGSETIDLYDLKPAPVSKDRVPTNSEARVLIDDDYDNHYTLDQAI